MPVLAPPPAGSSTHLVLLHPGALGDLVQAFPAFEAARAGAGRGRLTLVTDASLVGLAHGTGLFDAVVGFDAAVAYRGGALARVRLVARLVARLRRLRPDAIALFKGAPVYALLAAASGAPVRAGLVRGRAAALLTAAVPLDASRHHADRYLDVVRALGFDPRARAVAHWPAERSALPEAFRHRFHPLIGIAPGGARNAKQDMPTKRWASDRYAKLAAALLERHPHAGFVLFGARSDGADAAPLRALLPPERVVDLVGRATLAAARGAIAELDLYLGNDSGLMHVAATTATPLVIAFGPTDPRVIAPRGEHIRTHWSPAQRPPCFDEITGVHRACVAPCCIDRLDVDELLRSADAALAGARAARDAPIAG